MNDQFYEQLVKKKTGAKEIAVYVLVTAVLILAALEGFLFLGMLIVPVTIVIIFLVYKFVLSKLKVEYEYSIVNYDLQIDAIFNKEKRKEIISLSLRDAELIAKAESDAVKRLKVDKTYNLTSRSAGRNVISIIIKKGNIVSNVMIEPDEDMLSHIKDWSGSKFQA